MLEATTFGERARVLRQRLGLTQQEVADGAGVNVGTINRWEKGKTPVPKGDNLEQLAAVLGTSSRYLLTGSNEVESSPQLEAARAWLRSARAPGDVTAFFHGVARQLEQQRRIPDDAFFRLLRLAFDEHTRRV